jgi:hypothetical protein
MDSLYTACICGGWIEVILLGGGVVFAYIWLALKKICVKLGCNCNCHKE